MGMFVRMLDFCLVVLVQSFMLVQCGFFYARGRLRAKKIRQIVPSPSKEELIGPITIVIPVLNEAASIERTLRRTVEAANDPERLELVVADSGCTDDTLAVVERLSKELPAKVVVAASQGGGRGGAINAGLEASDAADAAARSSGHTAPRGALILFLHADTYLPNKFDFALRTAFQRGVLMTAFRFQTDRACVPAGELVPAGMAFMEWTVNLRSYFFQLPFGDQALAVTRQTLAAMGGFPEYPILEEYELVQRLRRASAEGAGRIVTLKEPALCSPRRWLQRPIWRVNWVNQMVMIWYNHFSATPGDVFKYYYGRDAPSPRVKKVSQQQ
eukprot:TRINITY_DN33852_c0_g1_i1.p1 TRINITY_DN33852_c0_g1~~TRINITY_DN33852_c0_g1_i1.p1  ORF type:complete len:348 (-),score=47.54 TRINITY_DN33852_c0_g1_i1:62-1048(-)